MMLRDLGPVRVKTRSKPTKSAVVGYSVSRDPSGNDTGHFGGGQTVLLFKQDEAIVYTTKPKKNRKSSNICFHTKTTEAYASDPNLPFIKVANLGLPGYSTDYKGGHVYQESAHSQALPIAEASFPGTFGTGHLGVNAQAYINDAWSKAKPDLTVTSLPNFLWEWEDMFSLVETWRNRKKTFSLKRYKSGQESLSKNLASGTLQYSFGVAPAIGDVRDIIDAVRNTRARIRDFQSKVGIPQKVRLSLMNNTTSTTGTFQLAGDSFSLVRWTATLNQRVTAHFTFTPRPIPALNEVDTFLRGAMASLGVELNPRIIWDAIPFSFIIDWFTGIGKVLNSYKIPALELPVELTDSCLQYSEKRTVATNLSLDVNHTGVSSVSNWPTHATMIDFFQRMPILPDETILRGADIHRPSLRQVELGFALIVANAGGGTSRANLDNAKSSKTLSAIPFGNLPDGLLIR